MKLLAILGLSWVVTFQALADTVTERDPDLWQAINHINERNTRIGQDATIVAIAAASSLPFLAVGSYHYVKSLSGLVEHLAGGPLTYYHLHRMVAWTVPVVGLNAAAALWILSRHQADPGTIRERWRVVNGREEAKALRDLDRLLRYPLNQQYEIAIKNPDLHRYLLDLEAWILSGHAEPLASRLPVIM